MKSTKKARRTFKYIAFTIPLLITLTFSWVISGLAFIFGLIVIATKWLVKKDNRWKVYVPILLLLAALFGISLKWPEQTKAAVDRANRALKQDKSNDVSENSVSTDRLVLLQDFARTRTDKKRRIEATHRGRAAINVARQFLDCVSPQEADALQSRISALETAMNFCCTRIGVQEERLAGLEQVNLEYVKRITSEKSARDLDTLFNEEYLTAIANIQMDDEESKLSQLEQAVSKQYADLLHATYEAKLDFTSGKQVFAVETVRIKGTEVGVRRLDASGLLTLKELRNAMTVEYFKVLDGQQRKVEESDLSAVSIGEAKQIALVIRTLVNVEKSVAGDTLALKLVDRLKLKWPLTPSQFTLYATVGTKCSIGAVPVRVDIDASKAVLEGLYIKPYSLYPPFPIGLVEAPITQDGQTVQVIQQKERLLNDWQIQPITLDIMPFGWLLHNSVVAKWHENLLPEDAPAQFVYLAITTLLAGLVPIKKEAP